jgi:hypothetical protein
LRLSEPIIKRHDPEYLLIDNKAEYITTHVAAAVREETIRDKRDFYKQWAWDLDGYYHFIKDDK